MIDQGVTEFISINDVIGKEHPELKRQVEGLVLLGRLTESQAQELLHIRKRGRNKITAKKSRKKKDAEIGKTNDIRDVASTADFPTF